MSVICAQTDEEILDCWPVMVQLRPHLQQAGFVPRVRRQFEQGYRLSFVREGKTAVAVAGYRLMDNLICGRFCYVDDLVTAAEARSKGYGAELMGWLCQFAASENCSRLELDSGVQRFDAHRFYLRHQMFISCHHFSLELKDGVVGKKPGFQDR
jgi:GNAT superfamily N-acetyltransferase